MKKVSSLFIIFVLLCSMWGQQHVEAQSDIQLIYSVDDFKNISNQLNGHYRLMNDLDFKGAEQLPIGTKDKPFIGTFDGNGFSVSNYRLQHNESMTHIGLFAYAKNATFRNLEITNTDLVIGTDLNVELYGGALIGKGESVTIEDVHIASSVSVAIQPLFKSTVGGIAGEIRGTSLRPSSILNVSNAGTITGKHEIGGVVGSAWYTTIESAKNTGALMGGDTAGGVVGYLYQGKLNQAENEGNIKSVYRGGGVIGYASNVTIEKVTNSGLIQSTGGWGDFGGVVGYMEKTILSGSMNLGGFESSGNSSYVGGLVGEASQECIIRIGFNKSPIDTKGYVGGIVGRGYQTLIEKTYNEGDLSGSTGGGIAASTNNATVRNSFNIAKVQTNTTAGGLVGVAHQGSQIESSYNSGAVKAYRAGALVGYSTGVLKGAYGITQFRLIGQSESLEEQGQMISPIEAVTAETMPLLSPTIWEFSSESYPTLKGMDKPSGKHQHPIALKQIDLSKTTYRQYEELDFTNGQAFLMNNTGKLTSIPLDKSMLWQNGVLENNGDQSVSFRISDLPGTARVQVTPRYRAMFMNHQNMQVDVQYVEPGQKAEPVLLPEREGYTLQSWTPEFEPMTKDQVYKPIYTKNRYDIQLMDGEQWLDLVSFSHGERLSLRIQEPFKANHFFIGWYKDSTFSEKIDLSQNVIKSIDLYARFIPIPEVNDLKTGFKGGATTVTWKGTTGTSYYSVEVSNDPDFGSYTRHTTSEQKYDLSLSPRDTHYIRVKPIMALDNQEWEGSSSTVTQPPLLNKLDGVKTSDITSSSVKLSWNRQNFDQFYVYRAEDSGDFIQVATVKTSSWTDTKLNHQKNYQYKIVGYLNMNETSGLLSDESEVVSVRLKLPHKGLWEIYPVGENSTVVTGKASEPNGYVEVYKGSQKLGLTTKLINGSYKVAIPKQTAGTRLTVKFYPGSLYEMGVKTVYVQKTLPAFTVAAPAAKDNVLTGKGKPGATIRAYVGSTPISKSIKIGSNGTFKLTITPQTGGRELQVRMSQSGYLDRTVKTKVLHVFKTFRIQAVKSSHTYVTGTGNRGATVQAYVGSKAISKTGTVNTKGAYRLTIPKQKPGTVIKLRMTQNGYKTQDRTIKVIK
ncbi:MAG: Ig-like domain-containing protein [Exiguobacterium chiriqhucha]